MGLFQGIMKKILWLLPHMLVLIGAALVCERPAYAYADPGTGLLAIQAVGSALIATGWYLRRKIYSLLHRGQAKSQSEENSVATKKDGSPLQ
jgi:cytochrome c-type biogenesis protein CcmH/NrfF